MSPNIEAAPATKALEPLDINRRYDMQTAARYLGVCRCTVYTYIKRGTLRTLKDPGRTGKRWVPGLEIKRISTLPDSQAAA